MPSRLANFIELKSFGTIGYVVSALFAYFTYSNIIYPYYLGPLRNIPRGKNAFWHYITYMYDYITGNPAKHLKLTQKYGPVVHVRKNLVLVNDESVRQYYKTYKFPKAKLYSLFDINGPNLFSTVNKDFHVGMKKLIAPAFNNKTLAAMESSIYKVGSNSLVKYLDSYLDNEPNREFDFYHLFNSNTFDVITKMVFGTEFNSTWDEKKGYYYRDLLQNSVKWQFYRIFLPFINHIELPIETVFRPIILENIHNRRQLNEAHNDILQSMIDSEDPDTGAKLTDLEIVNECYILLLAGMDTTANTLTWTLYELLKHPESLDLVTTEVLNNFPNLSEPITINDAKKKLKYLEAALLEAMRLHPGAGGSIPREVPEGGVTICGHYIPPKVLIKLNNIFHS
jgi:cytochrome P450